MYIYAYVYIYIYIYMYVVCMSIYVHICIRFFIGERPGDTPKALASLVDLWVVGRV